MGWTPEELEEMRRADAQIEEDFRREKREVMQAYYARNRERRLAQNKAWREKNPEKVKKSNQAWREKNRERTLARDRAYYARNREKILERKKEQRRKKKDEKSAEDEKNAVVHISDGGDAAGGVLDGLGSGEHEPVGRAGDAEPCGAAAADLLEPFKRGGDTP